MRGSTASLARLAVLLRGIKSQEGAAARLGQSGEQIGMPCIGTVLTLLIKKEIILIFMVMMIFHLVLYVLLFTGNIKLKCIDSLMINVNLTILGVLVLMTIMMMVTQRLPNLRMT